MVRKRGGRKRALGLRAPMKAPDRPNACWSLDFVHDQMTDGRRFRILGVVDESTRECLADTSISGQRVARELSRIIAWRGRPEAIHLDNGTELTSRSPTSDSGGSLTAPRIGTSPLAENDRMKFLARAAPTPTASAHPNRHDQSVETA